MVLGQGTPSERRERLREYRWSSYPGLRRFGEKEIVLGQ
jgi:hypothetical protein